MSEVIDSTDAKRIPRMRLMPLFTERAGAYEETPFIVVFDKVGDNEPFPPNQCDELREAIGARAVVSFENEIDIE